MFDLLIIFFICVGLLLASYSIYNILNAMKFLRFGILWLNAGVGFIGGTILSIAILFMYLSGILNEYGWIIFIYPSITGPLSIRTIYILRRKLRAG
jgi:hypothetical protein